MRRSRPVLAALLLALPLVVSADTPGSEDWAFRLMPVAWLSEVRGEATVRGLSSSADLDLSDILEDLDIGVMAAGEARKDKLAFVFYGMYIDLGQEIRWSGGPPNAGIDVDFRTTILDGVATYRVFQTSPACAWLDGIEAELLAGARWVHMKADLDPSTLPSVEETQSWLDPILGTRLVLRTAGQLDLSLRFDVGGFGIGSDRTWRLTALFTYPLSASLDLAAGYQVISWDYDDGRGGNRFEFDARFGGPFAGVIIAF